MKPREVKPKAQTDRLGFCKGGAQTTVRRYKGLEAKGVLLVDVHVSKLVKPTCQRLVYVGSSRASAYLETIFLSDVSAEEYPALVEQLDTDMELSPQGVAKWLGMEAQ